MDQPSEDVLLRVAKVSQWQKAKAALITLGACMQEGSVQHTEFCEVVDQFVSHVEDNGLNQ